VGVLFFLACAGNTFTQAALQLDIEGAQPLEALQVRTCVSSAGERVVGARLTGRYAFPGLPADVFVDVGVDVLGEEGEVLAQATLKELDGFGQATLVDCTIDETNCLPCEGQGTPVENGDEAWLLVVRFLD
jgi:hypothetical protein